MGGCLAPSASPNRRFSRRSVRCLAPILIGALLVAVAYFFVVGGEAGAQEQGESPPSEDAHTAESPAEQSANNR